MRDVKTVSERKDTFKAGMVIWRAAWSVPHFRFLFFASTGGWILFVAAIIGMVVK